jgi:hypothetical protein
MIRCNFYLTIEQKKRLEKLSQASVAEHIRRAIDEYLKRHAPTYTTSPSKKGGRHG